MQRFAVSQAHLQPASLVESPAVLGMRPVLGLKLLRLGSLGSADGCAAQQVLKGRQGFWGSAALLPAQHALAQAQRFSRVAAPQLACREAQQRCAVQGPCDGAFCAGNKPCRRMQPRSDSEAGSMGGSWACESPAKHAHIVLLLCLKHD